MATRTSFSIFSRTMKRGFRTRQGGRDGFTLAEIMVVSFILAITSAGVLSLVAESFKVNAVARENMLAREALDNTLEDLRMLSFDQLTPQIGVPVEFTADRLKPQTAPDYEDDPNYNDELSEGMNGSYTITWDSADVQIGGEGNETIIVITVQVWWDGILGNRTLSQSAIFTNYADEESEEE